MKKKKSKVGKFESQQSIRKYARGKRVTKGLGLAVVIVLVVVALVLAVAYGYYRSKIGMLQPDETRAPDATLTSEDVAALEAEGQELASQMDSLLEGLEEVEIVEAQGEIRQEDDVLNILLIGTDERTKDFSDTARGDSCILFSVNTSGDAPVISLVSFERGLAMPILSGQYTGQYDWLTHLFRYGGAEMMMESLEESFKVDLDYYVRVNFTVFQEGINALGGVDIDLSQSEASFLSGYFKKSFKTGVNTLTGEHALQYARLRAIDDDWHRVERQRKVIEAALNSVKTMSLSEADSLINTCLSMVRTNLDEDVITELLFMLPSLGDATFQQTTIPQPGTYGGKTVMGGRGAFGADFQVNTEYLHEFIYGEYKENDSVG